jgi:hypothetical protein
MRSRRRSAGGLIRTPRRCAVAVDTLVVVGSVSVAADEHGCGSDAAGLDVTRSA